LLFERDGKPMLSSLEKFYDDRHCSQKVVDSGSSFVMMDDDVGLSLFPRFAWMSQNNTIS
jgi:hypothetical protein